jgi:hypothetical protein
MVLDEAIMFIHFSLAMIPICPSGEEDADFCIFWCRRISHAVRCRSFSGSGWNEFAILDAVKKTAIELLEKLSAAKTREVLICQYSLPHWQPGTEREQSI